MQCLRTAGYFVVAIGTVSHGSMAASKELNALAEFVMPAYTAMNFAVLCARDNPTFLLDASGPRGTALHYAQHIKDEAIDGLSETEATAVLKSAADGARSVARQKLHQLAGSGARRGSNIVGEVTRWCERDAKPFILKVMRQHDTEHKDLLERLQRSKQ